MSLFRQNGTAGAIDVFGRALGEDNKCGAVARTCLHDGASSCGHSLHINRGTDWFVLDALGLGNTSALQHIRTGAALAFLVRQESLDEDMDALWQWLCLPGRRAASDKVSVNLDVSRYSDATAHRHNDTWLSPTAAANFAMHTLRESFALEELERLAENGLERGAPPAVHASALLPS